MHACGSEALVRGVTFSGLGTLFGGGLKRIARTV